MNQIFLNSFLTDETKRIKPILRYATILFKPMSKGEANFLNFQTKKIGRIEKVYREGLQHLEMLYTPKDFYYLLLPLGAIIIPSEDEIAKLIVSFLISIYIVTFLLPYIFPAFIFYNCI